MEFAQQILNGFVLGGMYALLAISYTLVIGVLGMLNLAQGEVLMAGAFTAYALMTAGAGLPVAFVCAVAVGVFISAIIELFCFRLPKSDDSQTSVVTTIAMSLILQNVYTEIWGSDPLKFPRMSAAFRLDLGPVSLSAMQLSLLVTALLLMAVLSLVIAKTWMGREMRAVSQNRIASLVVGISIPRAIRRTFLLSGAIAGVAGVMCGFVFSSITPFVGARVGSKAMVAMVIGGSGSAKGSVIAGFALGLIEVLSVGYLGVAYREILTFVLLIVFLWVRPEGIFRQGRVDRI